MENNEMIIAQIKRIELLETCTLSELYIDNKKYCYLLEDPVRDKKVYGETAIDNGIWKLSLRAENSKMYLKYKEKYSNNINFRGMIELSQLPNKEYKFKHTNVYIHIGNFVYGLSDDTLGCPLTADSVKRRFDEENRSYYVGKNSTLAFFNMYEPLASHIEICEKSSIIPCCEITY